MLLYAHILTSDNVNSQNIEKQYTPAYAHILTIDNVNNDISERIIRLDIHSARLVIV